jgi:hypothetical protein
VTIFFQQIDQGDPIGDSRRPLNAIEPIPPNLSRKEAGIIRKTEILQDR